MSFVKKNNYPNVDKPGVYHNEVDKLNGINLRKTQNLEEFSLGNWEEFKRTDIQTLYPFALAQVEDVILLSADFDLDDLEGYGIFNSLPLESGGDIISVQAMRFSSDGLKLFVLTRQVKQNTSTKLTNGTIDDQEGVVSAKRLITYNLSTPFQPNDDMTEESNVDFQDHLPWIPVDFYIRDNKLIFLETDQDNNYNPTGASQLVQFTLNVPYSVSSFDTSTKVTNWMGNGIPNAKSFDIVDNGDKLFVLYGESPIYQVGSNQYTGAGYDLRGARFEDSDVLQAYDLPIAYDIGNVNKDEGNVREIFPINPNIDEGVPDSHVGTYNRSNNLRYFQGGSSPNYNWNDWSGLPDNPFDYQSFGGDPLVNPIFMEREPHLEERKSIFGNHRELGVMLPRVIRFHQYEKKMYITGVILEENYRDAEWKNTDLSYSVRISQNPSFQAYIFQYNFDSISDISESYYTDRTTFGGSYSSNIWNPNTETYGFEIAFYDVETDPKVSILRTQYDDEDPTGGNAEIPRLKMQSVFFNAINIERINRETLDEFFLDSTSELYQQYKSLINIPEQEISPPEPVDLKVMVFASQNDVDNVISKSDLLSVNNLLYFDIEDEKYIKSSFPIKVHVAMDLLEENGLDDIRDVSYDIQNTPNITEWKDRQNHRSGSGGNPDFREPTKFTTEFDNGGNGIAISDSIFYYDVIQWGDETTQLSVEDIIEKHPLCMELGDVLENEDFNLAKFKLSTILQHNFKPMRVSSEEYNLISHSYTSPGIKQIKIIVLRYSKNQQWLLETSLISKNIVVNDGNLKIQDFEIFGGSDYNFLPFQKNQIIIGGIDEDSKYMKSAKNIRAENLYGKDDFLTKNTNNTFLKQHKDGLFGRSPESIDLGNIRTFSGARKINDMIGNFNITGSQLDNTLISNIFIDEVESEFQKDMTLELNPQKKDFETLQNTMGTDKSAILIGDYELEKKSEDKPIKKKGVMNIPQIETNKNKQAI